MLLFSYVFSSADLCALDLFNASNLSVSETPKGVAVRKNRTVTVYEKNA
jgi:hypothetical protein